MTSAVLPLTYLLPIRVGTPEPSDTDTYLRTVAQVVDEVVVVDGSDPPVFDEHARRWGDVVRHVRPDPQYGAMAGKAQGVHTGMELATNEGVVIADDDIRWTPAQLRRMAKLLERDALVRPQNAFTPLVWHARHDTGRILLNRLAGGDHGGTVGVRRSRFLSAGGYDGRVLFENLQLERTIAAAGGTVRVALDLVVERRPPTTGQFLRQRVRQAYDELARPWRLVAQLALLPALVAAVRRWSWPALGVAASVVVLLAEAGRRRAGGSQHFEPTAALWAPGWVLERSVTSWLAVASRAAFGGVRWGDRRIAVAATRPRPRAGNRPSS